MISEEARLQQELAFLQSLPDNFRDIAPGSDMWQKLYATGTATTREAMHNWLHAPRIVIGTEPTEKQKDRFAKDGIQLKYLTSVYRFEWEHLTCIGREYNEAVICCNGNDAKELVSALNTLFRYANLNVRAISGIA